MPSLPREQTVRTTGRVAGSLLRWWAAYYWAWEYGLWADGEDAQPHARTAETMSRGAAIRLLSAANPALGVSKYSRGLGVARSSKTCVFVGQHSAQP